MTLDSAPTRILRDLNKIWLIFLRSDLLMVRLVFRPYTQI